MKKVPKIQPNVSLIVDKREDNTLFNNLSDIFKNRAVKTNVDIKLEWDTLPVGDFWYKYGEKTVIIIERKTLNDLNSSIASSRYREQKNRIIESVVPLKYYLVEGTLYGAFNSKIKKDDYPRIYGAIVNTTVRDKIPVIRSENMCDTTQILLRIGLLLNKMGTQLFDLNKVTPALKYVDSYKPSKKSKMTPKLCYIQQLSQIPGVSVNMAETIAKTYSNMSKLITAYIKLEVEKDRIHMLKNLVQANGRKIGPVVSERICQYLYID